MTHDEELIVIHVMKQIADRERKHIEWTNGMLDMLCKELNIDIPERVPQVERRKKGD